MKIYPAILTDSVDTFAEQLEVIKSESRVDVVHVDIIDSYFVDNLTIEPIDLTHLDFGKLKIDFHLMTEEPLGFAEEIINCQDYLPTRAVIGQIEKMTNLSDFVNLLLERKIEPGLALNLFTPDEEIPDEVFRKLSVLQLMAIEAGEQGREFDHLVLPKIEQVVMRAKKINPYLEIIVDGGIKIDQLSLLKPLSVGGVAVGSALWQNESPSKMLESFFND
jgi:ribulose-phosphate 3-epimerase